jgi:tRNA threonylcarbamoyladenosine biosynthesis protein TsaE
MRVEVRSGSTSETMSLGKKFASYLTAGTVVVMSGELGAGKTTFTKGIAEGLGIEKQITSPTFVIAKEYPLENNITFIHIDAYRLGSTLDIADLDLEEKIDTSIVVAEWGDGFVEHFGKVIHVRFTMDSEDRRIISIASDDIESMSL